MALGDPDHAEIGVEADATVGIASGLAILSNGLAFK
jgi:hypothetical protein